MEQKTATSITQMYEPNHDFPIVTICNLNAFNTYNLTTINYLADIIRQENISYPFNATLANMSARELVNDAMKVIRTVLVHRVAVGEISEEFLRSLGFSVETLLVSCYFIGVECSAKDFKFSRNYDHGNCYTFGPAQMERTSHGTGSGLELELFSGIPGRHFFRMDIYLILI